MRRIVFVIPTLDQSGAERQLTLLATGLPRDEYDVRVIALNRGGHYADILRREGIHVDVLQKRFRFDPLTWWRLRARMHRLQPHIVQSYLFAANSYVRLPGVCPKRTRCVVSERCVDSWKSGWQMSVDRRLASRMDMMIANSQSVAAFYRAAGVDSKRIQVIPNGIPLPADPSMTRLADREYLRQQLGLETHKKVVGFVGRLAPQKRLEDVVWSFQLLHQAVNDVHLVLIGDGPDRDRLAEFAGSMECRQKMTFAGHRDDAARLMGGLDAFVLASEFEGMSNSLMEAMSLGLPVVVSDIEANRELITHDVNGLTFPLGNSPELTRALKRVLDDRTLADALGAASRDAIRTRHSVEQLVSAHRTLYDRLAATAAPAGTDNTQTFALSEAE